MSVSDAERDHIMTVLKEVRDGIVTLNNFTSTVEILIKTIVAIDQQQDLPKQITTVTACLEMLCSNAPANIRPLLKEMIELSVPLLVPALLHVVQAKAKLSASLAPRKAVSILDRKFCFKKGIEDPKDLPLKLEFLATALPPKVDLRQTGFVPAVMDQQSLGSCTAHGASCCLQFALKKQKIQNCVPSRLYIYYTTRVYIEHENASNDSGCQIKDVMKAVASYHVCDEEYMTYDVTKYSEPPSGVAVANANLHLKFQYLYVRHDETAIKRALNAGFPITFGIQIFDSFESAEVIRTGVVPTPDATKNRLLGGHCMTLLGYDDALKHFIVRNSWGEQAGDGGDFYLSYDYVLSSLASDFWTVKFFQ